MRVAGRLFKRAAAGWVNDRGMRLAASLSFFTMLSLAPLLLITLRVIGLILGPEAAAGEDDTGGTIATLVSIGILIFSASYVFAELQDAMNTVWDVPTREGWAVWRIIRNRVLAFAMVLSLAFLLLVAMVISSTDRRTVHLRPVAGRAVSRPGHGGRAVRRRGLARRAAAVGLLLGDDLFLRGGVYQGVYGLAGWGAGVSPGE